VVAISAGWVQSRPTRARWCSASVGRSQRTDRQWLTGFASGPNGGVPRPRGAMTCFVEEATPSLLTVARNLSLNARRKSSREQPLVDRLTEPTPLASGGDPGDELPGSDEVRVALETLKAIDRELILLVVWDELKPAEAGRVLGLRPAAARSRLHRARIRLTELLDHDPGQTTHRRSAPARVPIDHSILRKDSL
jgi:hypothetical protein